MLNSLRKSLYKHINNKWPLESLKVDSDFCMQFFRRICGNIIVFKQTILQGCEISDFSRNSDFFPMSYLAFSDYCFIVDFRFPLFRVAAPNVLALFYILSHFVKSCNYRLCTFLLKSYALSVTAASALFYSSTSLRSPLRQIMQEYTRLSTRDVN